MSRHRNNCRGTFGSRQRFAEVHDYGNRIVAIPFIGSIRKALWNWLPISDLINDGMTMKDIFGPSTMKIGSIIQSIDDLMSKIDGDGGVGTESGKDAEEILHSLQSEFGFVEDIDKTKGMIVERSVNPLPMTHKTKAELTIRKLFSAVKEIMERAPVNERDKREFRGVVIPASSKRRRI